MLNKYLKKYSAHVKSFGKVPTKLIRARTPLSSLLCTTRSLFSFTTPSSVSISLYTMAREHTQSAIQKSKRTDKQKLESHRQSAKKASRKYRLK